MEKLMKKLIAAFVLICLLQIVLAENEDDLIKNIKHTFLVPDDYPTIQEAIDHSFDDDRILVRPGIYTENINFNGTDLVLMSLNAAKKDTSFISRTIIKGTGKKSVVRFSDNETSAARLIGFTITGGIGTYDNPAYNTIILSSDEYQQDILRADTSKHFGGGIYCSYANPTLKNLIISGNTADMGGGLFLYNSNAGLENILIEGNEAFESGGGSCFYSSNPRIEDVQIQNNISDDGAGISCIFNSSPHFIRTEINLNTASQNGGGVYCSLNSNPTFKNTLFIENGSNTGGALYCYRSSPYLENVTISANSANNYTAGIYCFDDSNPIIMNSIIWQNMRGEISFSNKFRQSSVTISYSDVYSGKAGINNSYNGSVDWKEGNIERYPIFAENYELIMGSPCQNTGNPKKQFDDKDKSQNDMGAFGGPNGDIGFWFGKMYPD